MKYMKMLGLAAVAAMALMAFAANSASATTLESGSTLLPGGTEIKSSLSGSAVLSSGGTTLDTCTVGGVTGKTNVESATWLEGEASVTWGAKGAGCINTTDTLKGGIVKIMWTSGLNGAVVSSGAEVTVETLGTSCIYGTNNTSLGTLEGTTSGDAKLVIDATVEEKEPKKFLCPDTATWQATYVVSSPTPLSVTN